MTPYTIKVLNNLNEMLLEYEINSDERIGLHELMLLICQQDLKTK